jgi:hypothetical protein
VLIAVAVRTAVAIRFADTGAGLVAAAVWTLAAVPTHADPRSVARRSLRVLDPLHDPKPQ